MFFACLLTLIVARQVEIKPHGTFEFSDLVSKNDIYKFKYSTMGNVEVSLFDPSNRLVFTDTNRSASLYTNVSHEGKFKVVVKNRSQSPIIFSYKSPDPNKELIGHMGYVKDVDSVEELARFLEKLIKDQKMQLERTKVHQKMVQSSRFWTKALLISEFILTIVAAYVIQKDFVAMFEKKQTL